MILFRSGASLLVLTALAGCTGLKAGADYDPAYDLSTYRTFAWVPEPPEETPGSPFESPIIHERIRKNILDTLTLRGFQEAASGKPDFYVGHHLSFRTKVDVQTLHTYYPHHWRYPYRGFETRVREYDEGTLVIDIIDARDEKLVWRGWTSRRLDPNPSREKSEKRIREAVAAILEQFPPGTKPSH